ncbi:MAG: ABC-F family ATP-binding cassette domain-containing protein [bacterium]
MAEEVILRFDEVTFEFAHKQPLLDEASFSVRKGSKITLMGQNGAGKSTLFKLITGELKPKSGTVSVTNGATIGTAKQVIDREDFGLTIEEYFSKIFEIVPVNIKSQISKAMEAVNFIIPTDRKVGDLSGGQKARLLLSAALIQNPDILLLDEPTNNLDKEGIEHLISFLVMYPKTVIVISHDADFLNCFTDGVIYLDIFTKRLETYVGDYYSVVEEINQRIEREIKKNAQLEKQIQDRKDKVNFFSHKGGKMRKLASKLREETEEMEENKVEVGREDRTIRNFTIPSQEDILGDIVTIDSVKIIENHEPVIKKINKIALKKRTRLLVSGSNGIGKTTLLRSLVANQNEGAKITDGVVVGYYSQDFSNLNFEETVFNSLKSALPENDDDIEHMRSVAAGFLITGNLMVRAVAQLSEGQKGLLSFARLVLMRPGLLVLDEPTNHINFRHIPVIAKAIQEYDGAMILISHMSEFVKGIEVNEHLDLGKI